MLHPRFIPCLLLDGNRLVKTVAFGPKTYLGDPRNAVRIFNEREVDELILLDISATIRGNAPNFRLAREILTEAFMPCAVGGGISKIEHARQLFAAGADKVVLCTAAMENSQLIREMAAEFGSQSLVISLDVRRNREGENHLYVRSGRTVVSLAPTEAAEMAVALGAGEILVSSIDRDGAMSGYDLDLIRLITDRVHVPVVALGGAGSVADLVSAVRDGGASAAAAGSLFVYHGRQRGVLINYPDLETLDLGTLAATL